MTWPIPTLTEEDFRSAVDWDGDIKTIPDASHVLVPNVLARPGGRAVNDLFDELFRRPKQTFWMLTDYRTVRNVPTGHSFGWTDLERTPFSPGEYFNIEDMYYRNQCGWVHQGHGPDNDWQCAHPDSQDDEGYCSARSCPIAENADSLVQLEAIGIADDFDEDDWREEDGERYVEESDWIELYVRPRDAQVKNCHVGFLAENKLQWQRNAREFLPLRYSNPYLGLFAVLTAEFEQPMTFRAPTSEDRRKSPLWHPSELYEFGHGGERVGVPYLNGIWRIDNFDIRRLEANK